MAGEKIRTGDIVDKQVTFSKLNGIINDYYNMHELKWISGATNYELRINATSDCPAGFAASGLYLGRDRGYVLAQSDGRLMQNTANTTNDISLGNGAGKLDAGSVTLGNWYGMFACDNGAGGFDLRGVTFIRVKAEAAGSPNIISCGEHFTPANSEDYVVTTDVYIGARILVISGTARGKLVTVTGNDTSGGSTRFKYTSTALGLSAGDWLMISPQGVTNYRFVASVLVDSGGGINYFNIRNGIHKVPAVQMLNINASASGLLDITQAVSPLASSCGGYFFMQQTAAALYDCTFLLGVLTTVWHKYFRHSTDGATDERYYTSFSNLIVPIMDALITSQPQIAYTASITNTTLQLIINEFIE